MIKVLKDERVWPPLARTPPKRSHPCPYRAELAKFDGPMRPAIVHADGADEAAGKGINELGGRRDWTRTNDPYHVKVVL
jgi:hypothetical protein